VALVHLMARLAPAYGWSLAVGHVHHGLRASAQEDEAFVAGLARRLGLAFFARRLTGLTPPNLEARARAARYAALADMAREAQAQAVATGHTLDDQAETVLLRLLRGTGVAGLAGILPRRPLSAEVDVVRPLLGCRRGALRAYLTERGERWREDETNLDLRRARNRVRTRVLPLLQAENPRFAEVLAQLAEVVREEEAVWAEWVARALQDVVRTVEGGFRVDREGFLRLPPALQRRVLRELLGRRREASFVHLEEARRLLHAGQPGREVTLPEGVRVRLESGSCWLGVPGTVPEVQVPLPVPGRAVVPELGVMVEARLEPRDGEGPEGRWEAELDPVWAEGALVVRNRRPGDRIRLRAGTRKLQDLFTDLRVPRWERDRVPVVATEDGQVLWVVGFRVSEAAKPEPAAPRRLRLRAWPLETAPTPA
jgi:tRNA(Ile)-lysidine synthase